jgi:epoxyqueuosine reductase
MAVPFRFSEFASIASQHGFPLCGVTSAVASPGFSRLCEWLDRGYGGGMDYLERRREAYRHPAGVLPQARSLLMLGMPYEPAASLRKSPRPEAGLEAGQGRVAAYAAGAVDYHDWIHERLKRLMGWLKERFPECGMRGVVDSAPLLEREFAALAGLGWVGKNTLLLHRDFGSYFFLAAILLDIELAPSSSLPLALDHCGTCTACLDICPTQAFPQPRLLDARRCISYLTIEHRGPIPVEFREAIGDWVWGCDLCQQVCPWNRMAKPTAEEGLKADQPGMQLDLLGLLSMDEAEFRLRYRQHPFWRGRLAGMQRNALIVLGNQRCETAVATIGRFLAGEDPTLRATAAWALGQIGTQEADQRLREQAGREVVEAVRQEIAAALASRPRESSTVD